MAGLVAPLVFFLALPLVADGLGCAPNQDQCMGACYNPITQGCAECTKFPKKSIVCNKPKPSCCEQKCINATISKCCKSQYANKACPVDSKCCFKLTHVECCTSGEACLSVYGDKDCYRTSSQIGGVCDPGAPNCPAGARCIRSYYDQPPFRGLPVCADTIVPTQHEQTYVMHVIPHPPASNVSNAASAVVRINITTPVTGTAVVMVYIVPVGPSRFVTFAVPPHSGLKELVATSVRGQYGGRLLQGHGPADIQVPRDLGQHPTSVIVKYQVIENGIIGASLPEGAKASKFRLIDGVLKVDSGAPVSQPPRQMRLEWRAGSCDEGIFFLPDQYSRAPQYLNATNLPNGEYHWMFPFAYTNSTNLLGVAGVSDGCYIEARAAFLPNFYPHKGDSESLTVRGGQQGRSYPTLTSGGAFNSSWMPHSGLQLGATLTHISPAGSTCFYNLDSVPGRFKMGQQVGLDMRYYPSHQNPQYIELTPYLTVYNDMKGECVVEFEFVIKK